MKPSEVRYEKSTLVLVVVIYALGISCFLAILQHTTYQFAQIIPNI
jgi:hypothetical protein